MSGNFSHRNGNLAETWMERELRKEWPIVVPLAPNAPADILTLHPVPLEGIDKHLCDVVFWEVKSCRERVGRTGRPLAPKFGPLSEPEREFDALLRAQGLDGVRLVKLVTNYRTRTCRRVA
jgi:hypothetical protein